MFLLPSPVASEVLMTDSDTVPNVMPGLSRHARFLLDALALASAPVVLGQLASMVSLKRCSVCSPYHM